jgi:hypothetical protein
MVLTLALWGPPKSRSPGRLPTLDKVILLRSNAAEAWNLPLRLCLVSWLPVRRDGLILVLPLYLPNFRDYVAYPTWPWHNRGISTQYELSWYLAVWSCVRSCPWAKRSIPSQAARQPASQATSYCGPGVPTYMVPLCYGDVRVGPGFGWVAMETHH